MTIHTSYRGILLVGYDRKSKRHNWNIIVAERPKDLARVRAVCKRVEHNTKSWAEDTGRDDWKNYEQTIVAIDTSEAHRIPSALPRKHPWPVVPQEHPRVFNVRTLRQTCCKWCHDHNIPLREVLDGELWCPECEEYK